ncbi:MAG: alpha/beta hydrolase [Actinomycetota bacterium]
MDPVAPGRPAVLPAELTSRHVVSAGQRIHLVEAGPADGLPVILIHGFPESWYSWRHQLASLAAAGHRAIAVDVRGYGRSAAPPEIEAYAMLPLVGDVIAVIDDLRVADAVVVGHDWGAPIAWNTALLRPDRVRGVAGLSVPYHQRGDVRPLGAMRERAGDEIFYIDYFQEPGVAEAEIETDVAGWLRGFYFTASGEADPTRPSMGMVTPGGQLRDRLQEPASDQMAWLTDDDLAFYVGEFERSGFTGGLNRYRNVERDWEQLAAWRHAPITVPALYIGGERDGPTQLGRRAIERFDESLPGLTRSEILAGCGHWTQQERPDEVNELLGEFVAGLT